MINLNDLKNEVESILHPEPEEEDHLLWAPPHPRLSSVHGLDTSDGEFEGCDFDKKIIFIDGTYLTFATYSYTYSYMPTAYIYAKRFEYNGLSNI